MIKSKKLIKEAQELLDKLQEKGEELSLTSRECLDMYCLYIRVGLTQLVNWGGKPKKDIITAEEKERKAKEKQFVKSGLAYRRIKELDLPQEEKDMWINLLKSEEDDMFSVKF